MVKKMQKRWSGRFKFEWDVSSCHPTPINDNHLQFEKYIDLRFSSVTPMSRMAQLSPAQGTRPKAKDSCRCMSRAMRMCIPLQQLWEIEDMEEAKRKKKMQNTKDTLKDTPVPDTPSKNRSARKEQNLIDCLKDLHEKVFPDEAWSVTSLPKGYECVDAMFMVEAEGTCMLQQEIPVDSAENSLQFSDEESTEDAPMSTEEKEEEDSALSIDQEGQAPWSFPLLPGALETEEEKEMMEQKLVLEPRLIENKFGSVSMEYLDDSENESEVDDEGVKKEGEGGGKSQANTSVHIEQFESSNAEAEEKEQGEEKLKGCEPASSSSALHEAVDAKVVCH